MSKWHRDRAVASAQLASCRECPRCLGEGSRRASPSNKQLAEHRSALEAAASAGLPPPPRPPPQRQPCKACGASGLVEGRPEPCSTSRGGNPVSIAVVGGGIGGAALALALCQRGLTVTVYERDHSFGERAQGYGLTMQRKRFALAAKRPVQRACPAISTPWCTVVPLTSARLPYPTWTQ